MLKGLKHVIQFEYLNVVRRKAYLFSILFYLVIMVIVSFLPAIIDFFSSDDTINHGVALFADETSGQNVDINLLSEYFPHFQWRMSTYTELERAIATGEGSFAVLFQENLSYQIITTSYDFIPSTQLMNSLVRGIWAGVADAPVTVEWHIVDLTQEDGETVIADSFNRIGPAGQIIGNVLLVLTLMSIMSSGGTIMASVMKEKTSKIVELLFTSAAPTAIMLGKVIAAALVGLTTGAILASSIFIVSRFNNPLEELLGGGYLLYGYPMVTFVYLAIFFVIAFICMSFIYAGMAATVGDNQESATLATVPMFAALGSFYLGLMMHGNPTFISETFVNIVSYVPFVSPFVMIARLNTVIMPTWEIMLIIGLNMVYTIIIAFISAKIYQLCIMLFGHKITIRFLFKKLFVSN